MNINIIYDASAQNAPAGFKGAVVDAVAFLDSVLTANVTVNIAVGYGEIDGLQLTPGAIGESSSFSTRITYGQLLSTLPGELPATDPGSSGQVVVTRSEEKVLGFVPADTNIDGFVGFSSTTPFTYDPNHRAQAGEYDFIGVVEHEITEVLGRISMLDAGSVSILDLFRYSAPGVHTVVASQAAYFSIDGGITNLNNFNNSGIGDLADWAASAVADSALAFIKPGVANLFGSTDITLMDALGYGKLPPSVEITSTGSVTSQPVQMVSGVNIAGAGTTVTLFDGQTEIGNAKVQADGGWAIDVVLAPGSHVLTAQDHAADGSVITSGTLKYTLSAAAPPTGVLELAHANRRYRRDLCWIF